MTVLQVSSLLDPCGTSDMACFDVFLSHRGPDSKLEFCSFLYESLRRAGLRPFVDNKNIRKGEEGWQQIETALRGAKLVLVVFSEGFTRSQWCLDELEIMMQQPGKVMPVFYGVDTDLNLAVSPSGGVQVAV